MHPQVELHQIDDVPAGARVADYDELGGDTRAHLDEFFSAETHVVPDATPETFEHHDVIRFTDYYEVRIK